MPSHISKDGQTLLQLTKGPKSSNASPTAGTGGNAGRVAMPPKGKPAEPPKGAVANPPKSPKANKWSASGNADRTRIGMRSL